MIRPALALLALNLLARGEDIEFDLVAGERKLVDLSSAVDDSHLREPVGYAGPTTKSRAFTRTIELTNTGDKVLAGRLMTANGQAVWSSETLKNRLGPADGHLAAERIYSFWRDHRTHAGSGDPLASEPFAALNFWGYTLAGEGTLSLAKLAMVYGIESRFVQLNGHIAAEYLYDKTWHVLDGDQNAFYLRLDNKTIASADDLRADPFLMLRTKILGRYGAMNLPASTANAASLEMVSVEDPKPLHLKVGPAPMSIFALQPGEKLIYHCDTPPEHVIGTIEADQPDLLKEETLATLEHRVNPATGQRSDKGVLTVHAPFPIIKVVNETSAQTVVPKGTVFKAEIPIKATSDKVSVFMQCSHFALPLLIKGENSVLLEAMAGKAHVKYTYDAFPSVVVPDLRVVPTAADGKFPGAAVFRISTKPVADQLWWQISTDRAFSLLAPNFDTIVPATPALRFDPLTETFLSPGQTYYLRVKAHADGVWGEWSTTQEFRVSKPAPPLIGRFAVAAGGEVRFSWTGNAPEYLVFASNRPDFIPEVLAPNEIEAMEGSTVTQVKPNKNLVATVKVPEWSFTPEFRYYRVIGKKGDVLSVPSPLWKLPDEFATKLPLPTVLQARPVKKGKAEVYVAKLEKIPPPAPKPPDDAKPDANADGKPDAKKPGEKQPGDKQPDDKKSEKDAGKPDPAKPDKGK